MHLMMNSPRKKAVNAMSRTTSTGCGSVVSKRINFGLLVTLKCIRGCIAGTRNGSQLLKMMFRVETSKAKATQ